MQRQRGGGGGGGGGGQVIEASLKVLKIHLIRKFCRGVGAKT